jgi:hypothetical protein
MKKSILLIVAIALFGCGSKHEIKVDGCSCESISGHLYIPNCFTPDNNGMNDCWFFRSNPLDTVESFHLVVTDNGSNIFETYSISKLWDGVHSSGKNSGDKVSGVFNYFVKVKMKGIPTISYNGCVTVLTDVSKYKIKNKSSCNTDQQFTGNGFDGNADSGEDFK